MPRCTPGKGVLSLAEHTFFTESLLLRGASMKGVQKLDLPKAEENPHKFSRHIATDCHDTRTTRTSL